MSAALDTPYDLPNEVISLLYMVLFRLLLAIIIEDSFEPIL